MEKIVKTPNKLVYQSQRKNNSGLIFGFIFTSVFFVGLPLTLLIHSLQVAGVESLQCQRVEPTQVNCELNRSQLLGIIPGKTIYINQLKKAILDQRKDSDGNIYYKIILNYSNGQTKSLFFNYQPKDVNKINQFLANINSETLEIRKDKRWQILFTIPFISVFILSYFLVLIEETKIHTYTFDKISNQLIYTQKNFYIKESIIKYSLPLPNLKEVIIEQEKDSDGDIFYTVYFSLNNDDKKKFAGCSDRISSKLKELEVMKAEINQFLDKK